MFVFNMRVTQEEEKSRCNVFVYNKEEIQK